MHTVNVTPAAIAAFQSFYLAELDGRVQRSEVVGAITLKKGSAALFFESAEGKFTLVEKMPDVEEANVFDCVPREQWGKTVMLFGHATNTGGYIASGHATLEGNTLKIKLASGHYYRLEVDATLAHLQPFATEPPVTQPALPRQDKRRAPAGSKRATPGAPEDPKHQSLDAKHPTIDHARTDDESEDLTEDDLRRLRGEMPLSSTPRKKWKH